jgi:hypothetical protein
MMGQHSRSESLFYYFRQALRAMGSSYRQMPMNEPSSNFASYSPNLVLADSLRKSDQFQPPSELIHLILQRNKVTSLLSEMRQAKG